MISEFISTLRQMIQNFTFIVLDALDECTDIQELLEMIKEMVGWKGKLHILTTSRKERDIEEHFKTLISEKDTVCIQNAFVDEDICAYVRGRLQSDLDLARWRKSPEVQLDIEKALMGKANGMYDCCLCVFSSKQGRF
jgi:hypothetical protein